MLLCLLIYLLCGQIAVIACTFWVPVTMGERLAIYALWPTMIWHLANAALKSHKDKRNA